MLQREVSYSPLFTFFGQVACTTVSLPPGDIILVQLACPLNDIIFCLHHLQSQEQITLNYLSSPYNVCKGCFHTFIGKQFFKPHLPTNIS